MLSMLRQGQTHRAGLRVPAPLVVGAVLLATSLAGTAAERSVELSAATEVEGDLGTYAPVSCKADVPVAAGLEDDARAGTLRSLHADQRTDRLLLRIGVAEEWSLRDGLGIFQDERARIYVLLDYAEGGATAMPDGLGHGAPLRWDAAVRLGRDDGALEAVGFLSGRREPAFGFVREVVAAPGSGAIECSLNLPAAFRVATIAAAHAHWSEYDRVAPDMADREATPIAYHVVYVLDGEPVDAISATNEPLSGRRAGRAGGAQAAGTKSTLRQNAPNPFNPTTAMSFVVAGESATRALLEVYDPAGRLVATLVDRKLEPGDHSVVWEGRDGRGRRVASGVYFARLLVGGETDARRMIMLK